MVKREDGGLIGVRYLHCILYLFKMTISSHLERNCFSMRVRGRGDHSIPLQRQQQTADLFARHPRYESSTRARADAVHPRTAPFGCVHCALAKSACVSAVAEWARGREGPVSSVERRKGGRAEGGELCAVNWDEPCRAWRG